MNKSIGLIVIITMVGAGIYYFGLLETETTIKITTESSFVLSVYYSNPEGDKKHVFLDDQGDKEWKIKGEVTKAVLQINYPYNYCKMEIYRGPRLLWSKESPEGEILTYNKDIT